MVFNEKLQRLRKEKGLSQENLAELIGVSRQAVAKWESGLSYPEVDKLIDISNLFKMSIDKLIKDKDLCSAEEEIEKVEISDDEIRAFLCRAKKATYAGNGPETHSSRPKSHDLAYAEDNFKYIDTYLGGEKFGGEEAVWKDDAPIWSMNYFGRVLSEGFSSAFLKEVLLLVSKETPCRGPMVYENGEYRYHCVINGDFHWFSGHEEIFYSNRKVYECVFHGGDIK